MAASEADGQPLRLRVPSGIRWRPYADGVVVRVPTTCEVHVLAPEYEPIFAPGMLLTDAEAEAASGDCLQLPRDVLLHLAELQILEAA